METQAIVPGSLSAIAAREGQSLAETFLNADAVILVDTSGSMMSGDSRGGRSRYNVALEELAHLQAHMPGKLAVIAFSDSTVFAPGGQPPLLGSGTNLAGALRFAKCS
ncbi:MAG TPA: VWA domain-containing protein [Anaerolineae bacterium]|nr:VWA domain-containing protein [Anaerolineae bacterium]